VRGAGGRRLPVFEGPSRRCRCGCLVQIVKERRIDAQGRFLQHSTIIRVPCSDHPRRDSLEAPARYVEADPTVAVLVELAAAIDEEAERA
jgi:hypothetical protein